MNYSIGSGITRYIRASKIFSKFRAFRSSACFEVPCTSKFRAFRSSVRFEVPCGDRFGHVMWAVARNKDFIRTLTQKLLQWKPTHRKRSRDRPSKSWLDCVKEDYYVASGCNSNVEDITIAAEDRKSGGL